MFRRAGTAEVLRSHQKDDFYLSYLRSSLADIVQTVAGARRWMRWRKELDVVADAGYFLLTTLSGLQTVGEEYVNIIQTDQSLRSLPQKWRRVLMVLLQVFAPYALRRSLENIEKTLRSSSSPNLPPETRKFLLESIPTFRHIITVLHRCHLATFYLEGIFYHLAKRLSGIYYVQYMAKNMQSSSDQTFRILGWISLLQLTGSLCLQLFCLWRKVQTQLGESTESDIRPVEEFSGYATPDRKCSLCLEIRKSSTVTPCGHLFCWTCIHEWCQTKAECPLCRDKCPSNRLVFLHNYDTS